MSLIEKAKADLRQLEGKSRFEMMTGIVAILTSLVEPHGIRPCVVGGLAVEVYTRNEYTTVDIDLVMTRRDLAHEQLIQVGFEKEGRYWYHPILKIGLEIPDDELKDADKERVIKLNLPGDKYIYVIGIEDIILDRLRACIHWKSESDCEWAYRLYKTHEDRLDKAYIQQQSQADLTWSRIQEWMS